VNHDDIVCYSLVLLNISPKMSNPGSPGSCCG